MKYLHTMVRVSDLDVSLDFYCTKLGLKEVARKEVPAGRSTLVFLAAPGDEEPAQAPGLRCRGKRRFRCENPCVRNVTGYISAYE